MTIQNDTIIQLIPNEKSFECNKHYSLAIMCV